MKGKNSEILFSVVNPSVIHECPKRHYSGDCGYDLTAVNSIIVSPKSFAQVSTNIRVSLPSGTWGMIIGRSSSFYKRGLMVYPGIIDGGWTGELFGMVYNLTEHPVIIKPGDRVVQFIVFNLVIPECKEVSAEDFPTGERGENGFGSTGGIS